MIRAMVITSPSAPQTLTYVCTYLRYRETRPTIGMCTAYESGMT